MLPAHPGAICKRLETLTHVDVIIGTVPASAQPEAYPPGFFARTPVVLDAAYRPRSTPLLRQAREHGCRTVSGTPRSRRARWKDRREAPASHLRMPPHPSR